MEININKEDDEELSIRDILNYEFKILEDEIDIQEIEEYKTEYTERCIDVEVRHKMNEILQAVKQLDRKLKEKE